MTQAEMYAMALSTFGSPTDSAPGQLPGITSGAFGNGSTAFADGPNAYGPYAGSTEIGENAFIGPGRARVTPPSMYDSDPQFEINIGDQTSDPVFSQQERDWFTYHDFLRRTGASQEALDYHLSQFPGAQRQGRWEQEGQQAQGDADIMQRAMQARASALRRR